MGLGKEFNASNVKSWGVICFWTTMASKAKQKKKNIAYESNGPDETGDTTE